MDRNIKYKTICRVGIYGDDDINTLSNSQYNIYPSSITGITVVNGGSNYSQSATQINVIGSGSGATVSFNVTSGVITTITIINGGVGYTNYANVIITSGITNTSSIVAGSGYTNGTYNLIIAGGGGSGASGTFTITGGGLASISIVSAVQLLQYYLLLMPQVGQVLAQLRL